MDVVTPCPCLHLRALETITGKFIAQGPVHIGYCWSLGLLHSANTLFLSAKYKKISDLYIHINNGSRVAFARHLGARTQFIGVR
jgi:hypothetical protein